MEAQNKGMAIKEYDTNLDRVERENFDLKMQVTHLKSRLKEVTNQSFSILPSCDCQKKEQETNNVLEEAKTAMEQILKEKEELQRVHAGLYNKIAQLEEENHRARQDCTKLSEHIEMRNRKEQESTEALALLKQEILQVKEEIEQTQKLKDQNRDLSQAYSELKEQTLKLEQFSKQLESDYKREVQKSQELQENNQKVSQRLTEMQSKMRTLVQQVEAQTKHNILGEKAVEELRKDKNALLDQKAQIQARAEEIIAEREKQISQTQNAFQRLKEKYNSLTRVIYALEPQLEQEIFRIEHLIQRTAIISENIDHLRAETLSVLANTQRNTYTKTAQIENIQQRMGYAQTEANSLLEQLKEAQEVANRMREEKYEREQEVRELKERIRITPQVAQAAKELGIHEFTTISELFSLWMQDRESISNELKNQLLQREQEHARAEAQRNRKIDEFQNKLKAALSELNACRSYLNEKKALIKALKKHNSQNIPILRSIDVSTDK
ncbi:hypothetical protein NEOKW01_1777 [Nematocida sp. AWRm80]|nr:hypothetical protein NEOKW01_1777 [Nematocida sp. AWRm80]